MNASHVEVARLFGDLLLRELERKTLEALKSKEVAQALRELGVEVPESTERSLESLAADYYDFFVDPKRMPPIQSLWERGTYQSDLVAQVQSIAEQAGLEFQESAARQAPPDHLGALMLLWSEVTRIDPDASEPFFRQHLSWGKRALEIHRDRDGFYGQLCRAIIRWLELLEEDVSKPATS